MITMARLLMAALLVAALVAAAEGRIVHDLVAPLNATAGAAANESISDVINGRMLGGSGGRADLVASLRASLEKAKSAQKKFKQAKAPSRLVKNILSTCAQNYDDLVRQLQEVQKSVNKMSHSDLVQKMSDAATFATDCDNWWEERNMKSPYEAMQRQVASLVSKGLGIAAHSRN